MSHDDEQQDSLREDPTLTAPADPTQSIAQSTPPTQPFPTWTPPYPAASTPPAAPPPSAPPPPAAPPPSTYPYAGNEPLPTTVPVVPPPAAPPAAYTGYGQPTYGPPAYGPPPPAALPPYSIPNVAYAPPQQTNASALVLTIISGILAVSCYFTLVGIPSLIIGIIALTKQNTDYAGSRRLSRIGWITFAVVGVLYVLAIAAFIAIAVMSDSGSSSYQSSYES